MTANPLFSRPIPISVPLSSDAVRRRTFKSLHAALCVIAPLVLGSSVVRFLVSGSSDSIVFHSLAVVAILFAYLHRTRISYRVQVWVVVCAILGMSVNGLTSQFPAVLPELGFAYAPVIAAIFLGLREAGAVGAIGLVLLAYRSLSSVPLSGTDPVYLPPVFDQLSSLLLFGGTLSAAAASLFTDVRRMGVALQNQQTSLKECDQRLKAVFDGVPDAVVVFQQISGEVLACNDSAGRLFGYSVEQMRFLTIADLSSGEPDYSGAEGTRRIQAVAEGQPIHFAWHGAHANGTLMWLDVSLRFSTLHGRPIVIAVFHDTTETRFAQETIRQLNEDLERRITDRTAALEEANRELEAFSYSVSHDLRSPLRAVDGFSHVLLEDHAAVLNSDARRCLSNIRHGAQRMNQMIEDLLTLSRTTRAPLQRQGIEVGEMVRQITEEVSMENRKAETQVIIGSLPPCLADPGLLRQVFANLISNALKFSAHRARPRVEVHGTYVGREVMYTVRDNGAGFDMRYAEKLFGVFQRLHSEEEFPGTGIGLAIVKRIVERHGGRIWAESAPDRGSSFAFTLPM